MTWSGASTLNAIHFEAIEEALTFPYVYLHIYHHPPYPSPPLSSGGDVQREVEWGDNGDEDTEERCDCC